MSSELLCKDCKHSFRSLSSFLIWGSGTEWRCHKAFVEKTVEHDPVTGPKTIDAHYQRCSSARGDWRSAVCGKDGKLWEPKSKKHFFLAIKHSDKLSR
jgi:hypothetical protein